MHKPIAIFLAVALGCLGIAPDASAQSKGKKAKKSSAAAAAPAASSEPAPKPSKTLASSAKNTPPPEGMCISPDAPQRVSECPSNAPKNAKTGAGGPSSKLQEAKRKVEQPKGLQVKGPSIELDVATLRNKEKTEKKAKDLLLRELQVTKRRIKNPRTNDPRRADFLLRLAEGYFELVQTSTSDVRKLDEPIHEACSVKKDKGKCNTLKKQQADAEKSLQETREDN